MRLLLYEFVTGGGWRQVTAAPPTGSLLCEGQAMLLAAADDFQAIENVSVDIPWDARLPLPAPLCSGRRRIHPVESVAELNALLGRLAATVDYSLIVAPEFDAFLLDAARRVISAGGRLLGPSPDFIELASDKQRTAQALAAAGICVPEGIAVEKQAALPKDFVLPAVLKPRFGAGSQELQWICSAEELGKVVCRQASRLERFVPGLAVSVAAILRGAGTPPAMLPPCRQRLADDGTFAYLGGSAPLPDELAVRATCLARAALEQLVPAVGYVGVDLVLAADTTGDSDAVIEINPRLTTSYVGLRRLAETNLADAMLAAAGGRNFDIVIGPGRVEFSASGHVQHQSDQGAASCVG